MQRREELTHDRGQRRWLGGDTPHPKPEARAGGQEALPHAPKPEARGSRQEELPHAPTPEARGVGREDQPHVQGTESMFKIELSILGLYIVVLLRV